MADGSTWEPILEGAAAEAAWQAVRDIARAIGEGEGVRRRPADLTVFWAYIAGALDDEWTNARYDEAVDQLCDAIAGGLGGASLFGGLGGAAWALAHVTSEGTEVLDQIDELMAHAVGAAGRGIDLIGGIVGDGVYFLERAGSGAAPAAHRGLALVIDRLIAAADRTPAGTAWFTAPERVPPNQQSVAPDGYFNCGLAHGAPGPIALLGRAASFDPRAAELCRDALRWLDAQALPDNPRGRFPAWVLPGGQAIPTRTAWCYGDPGVAIAAWSGAVRVGSPVDRWQALAREAATRDPAACGVVDAGLCHGAAGLAHLYNRCYQASREPVFRDAARSWFSRALEMRRPDGLAGFAAWAATGSDGQEWRPAADLVEGAAGVGLALLAALAPTEPAWDRLFLCDLPAGA